MKGNDHVQFRSGHILDNLWLDPGGCRTGYGDSHVGKQSADEIPVHLIGSVFGHVWREAEFTVEMAQEIREEDGKIWTGKRIIT